MADALVAASASARLLNDAHMRYIITHPDHIRATTSCLDKTNALTEALVAMAPMERRAFIQDDTHAVALYRIYDTIVGTTATEHYKKDSIARRRSSVDRLFKALGVKTPATFFNYLPTRIFTQFCKGITYFEGENIMGRPVYHREASCAPISQKFIIPAGATLDQAATIRTITRLCYLERKVYDEIYKTFLHYQDIGHASELKAMERLYQDYFDDTLDVAIHYKDELPVELVITTTSGQRTTTTTTTIETYTKQHWTDVDVVCKKKVIAKTVRNYAKRQGFDKKRRWLLEASNERPASWEGVQEKKQGTRHSW